MSLNPPMQYSKTGLALTESFEGKSNTSYFDLRTSSMRFGIFATTQASAS
ncbi:MAG: hypothetical protein JWR07_2311 [Nevskia sp.]|nr:hypothetical protein [Nevskia sp.]